MMKWQKEVAKRNLPGSEKEFHRMVLTGWTQSRVCLLILISIIILPGCNASTSAFRPRWSSMLHRSAKIPHDATKEEIIAYVNQHIEPIHAWRSTSARIHLSGVPVPMKAMLAVEQPRQIRFTASGGLSGQSEFDVGSSEERLWFFVRRAEPKAIVTVKHEELDQMQDQMPIPFQPEWLMEVLNVSTIDTDAADLVRDPDSPSIVKLVSHHTNKQGQEIRKIMSVDLRKGEVRDHQLFDAQHRLLASAELNDYRQFPNTNAKLPYDIKLKFAQQNQSMRIVLNSVEVNPPKIPKKLWEIPHLAGYPVQEIGRQQLINSPTAIANRQLRDKPKAITNYEQDKKTGVWVQDQIIQTADAQQQPGRQHLSDALPFSAEKISPLQSQPALQKRTRPTSPISDAPLFNHVQAAPEKNSPLPAKQTVHQLEQYKTITPRKTEAPIFEAPPLPDFRQLQKTASPTAQALPLKKTLLKNQSQPLQNQPQWTHSQSSPPASNAETQSADIPEWAKGFKSRTSQKPISEPTSPSEFELPITR